MRKKFFAMYALVGALVASPVFTSCIDNEESPTVSTVRNAKAEQLKAAAALAQAQAEMEKAVAQAEIAYKNALTEKTTAEAQKAKAEAEEAILQSQYDILQLKNDIANWENTVFNALVTNYTTALDNVTTINSSILKKTATLSDLQHGLVTVQEYVKSETARLNGLISSKKATIEKLKGLEDYDNTELVAYKDELNKKTTIAYKKWQELKLNNGSLDHNDAVSSIKLATVLAEKELRVLSNGNSFSVNDQNYYQYFVMTDADGYVVLNQRNVEAYKLYIAEQLNTPDINLWLNPNTSFDIKRAEEELALAIAKLGTEADKADTKYQATSTTKDFTTYAKLADAKAKLVEPEKVYTEKKAAYDKAMAVYNEKKTAENEALAAKNAAQTVLTDATNDLNGNTDPTKVDALTAAVTAAQTAYDAAEDAYNDAVDATAEANDAVTEVGFTSTIKTNYNNAVDAVEDAEIAVAQGKDAIINCESTLNKIKENVEKANNFETYVAAFSGDDYAAYKVAKDEITAAWKEYSDVNDEYNAVLAIVQNTGNNSPYSDILAQIATAEEDIAEYEADLLYIRKLIDLPNENGNNSTTNYSEEAVKALIAIVEEQLKTLKDKLVYAQMKLDNAKAALDAYLAEGGEAEEA